MVFGLPRKSETCTSCIICGKEIESDYAPLVCDECKKAVGFAKKARAVLICGSIICLFSAIIIFMFFTRNIFVN